MEDAISVVVADDSKDYREALILALNGVSGLRVTGVAINGSELIELCGTTKPDICLTDVHMPNMAGLRPLKILRKSHQNMLLVAFSSHTTRTLAAEVIAAGAHAFFAKADTVNAISRIKQDYEAFCELPHS